LPWIALGAAGCVFGACLVMASMVNTTDVGLVASLMAAPFIPFTIATVALAFASRKSDGVRVYCIGSIAAQTGGVIVVWMSWFPFFREIAGKPLIGVFIALLLAFAYLAATHFVAAIASPVIARFLPTAPEGACSQCGYRLTGHALGARCPECGHR